MDTHVLTECTTRSCSLAWVVLCAGPQPCEHCSVHTGWPLSSLTRSGSPWWLLRGPTHCLLASGNFQTLISSWHTALLNSSSISFIGFPLHHPLFQVFLGILCWPLFSSWSIFSSWTSSFRLSVWKHTPPLMTSQPPAPTPFLDSRAPTQYSQNQPPSFSQIYITCLRLMEPPSRESRNPLPLSASKALCAPDIWWPQFWKIKTHKHLLA